MLFSVSVREGTVQKATVPNELEIHESKFYELLIIH